MYQLVIYKSGCDASIPMTTHPDFESAFNAACNAAHVLGESTIELTLLTEVECFSTDFRIRIPGTNLILNGFEV